MTESPTPESSATPEEASASTEEVLAEEEEKEEVPAVDYRIRRRTRPRVTISIRLDTAAESWDDPDDVAANLAGYVATDAPEGTTPIWNAPYQVRGGTRRIKARQMGRSFEFEAEDFRTFAGSRGDWLIREDDSGYVFALTNHAMEFMFEPVVDAEQVLPSTK